MISYSIIATYIWNDGDNLRSKVKIMQYEYCFPPNKLSSFPDWNFDGSSTGQSDTKHSDLFIKPVYFCKNPLYQNTDTKEYYLVLCQVMYPDHTPHLSNSYAKLNDFVNSNKDIFDAADAWFGIEQEYIILDKNGDAYDIDNVGDKIIYNHNQHYCSVGTGKALGRTIVDEHMNMCLGIGLDISGINAEVLLGQWEYQIGPVTSLNGSDQLWISRYILQRVAEKWGVNVSLHPKPLKGDWNGSGCHVNFSTKEMREEGGLDIIKETMPKLEKNHIEHIAVYGLSNEERLTGAHETSSINDFSFGFSTRDTSIRIPAQSIVDGKGYFEDRRPASNCDPYQVSLRMLETVYS
jgi:glutamine synthetase